MQNLASENITLFLHCYARGHPALQIISLQIITDILTAHPSLLALSQPCSDATPPASPSKRNADGTIPSPLFGPVVKAFKKALRHEDPHVQSTAVLSLSKLFLARTLTEPTLLHLLLTTYFSPDPQVRGNAATRQTLTYFLPVYARSRSDHAAAVATALVPLLRELLLVAEEAADADSDDDAAGDLKDWIGLTAVGAQVVDWTDPRRSAGEGVAAEVDGAVHQLLAAQLLSRVLAPSCPREERKVLLGTLGKVAVLSSKSRPDLVRGNLDLVVQAMEAKVAQESTTRNVLVKLETTLRRLVDAMAEDGEEMTTAVGSSEVTETAAAAVGTEDLEVRTSIGGGLGGSGSDDMPEAEGTVFGNDDDDIL